MIDPELLDLAGASSERRPSLAAPDPMGAALTSNTTGEDKEEEEELTELERSIQAYDRPANTSTTYTSPYRQSSIANTQTSAMTDSHAPVHPQAHAQNPFRAPALASPPAPMRWVKPKFHPFCCNDLRSRFVDSNSFLHAHPTVATLLWTLFANRHSPQVDGTLQAAAHQNHIDTALWLVAIWSIIPKYPFNDPNGDDETSIGEPAYYINGNQANIWYPHEWVKLVQAAETDPIRERFQLINANGYACLRLGCSTHHKDYAIGVYAEKHLADTENQITRMRHAPPPASSTFLPQSATLLANQYQSFNQQGGPVGGPPTQFTFVTEDPSQYGSSHRPNATRPSGVQTQPGYAQSGFQQTGVPVYYHHHHSNYVGNTPAAVSQLAMPGGSPYSQSFTGQPVQYPQMGQFSRTNQGMSTANTTNVTAHLAAIYSQNWGGGQGSQVSNVLPPFGQDHRAPLRTLASGNTSDFAVHRPNHGMSVDPHARVAVPEGFLDSPIADEGHDSSERLMTEQNNHDETEGNWNTSGLGDIQGQGSAVEAGHGIADTGAVQGYGVEDGGMLLVEDYNGGGNNDDGKYYGEDDGDDDGEDDGQDDMEMEESENESESDEDEEAGYSTVGTPARCN